MISGLLWWGFLLSSCRLCEECTEKYGCCYFEGSREYRYASIFLIDYTADILLLETQLETELRNRSTHKPPARPLSQKGWHSELNSVSKKIAGVYRTPKSHNLYY